jgi:uncharacterized protein YyaL (SSP411 family)
MKEEKPRFTNSLVSETSPYLLQHAHNPVNWMPWNQQTLDKAKAENKLMLISVGYSACHWCHVMEHESFEDETVAAIMNDHFICIKVDREERPDIDQVYMLAVQLMTGHGGWPLNCFALPDGRPVYGGTYFPKQQWINVLLNLSDLYRTEPEKALEYAAQLTEGVRLAELVKEENKDAELNSDQIRQALKSWEPRFDNRNGGPDKAPKFPLPNNYLFLLRLSALDLPEEKQNEKLRKHIDLTLTKMAYGGIYDQIGGGFARYSVDAIWKVPHFEKMLYDNAQLVSLYSEAYQLTRNNLYRQTIEETLEFIERELTAPGGGFYSALDADSEGVEGKYYIWTKEELQKLLGDDFRIAEAYYNVNDKGYWEDDHYILLRDLSDEEVAAKLRISTEDLHSKVQTIKKILLEERSRRIRPGLDNKILVSWNCLMIKGYIDASIALSNQKYLETAIKQTEFILSSCLNENLELYRLAGSSKIRGFLEDYCHLIEALISLYQATFKERYILLAERLMEYCDQHFSERKSGMFYFTSDLDAELITRKMELTDNVIPASNSVMANCLFLLGNFFGKPAYLERARSMLSRMVDDAVSYGAGYSNWLILHSRHITPFNEVAIVGKSVDEKLSGLRSHYLPNVIFAATTEESSLPLLKDRLVTGETLIYVCRGHSCRLPVSDTAEALKLIREA